MGVTSHLANVEQANAWDGEEGEHWSTHAERYDAAVKRYDRALFEAAAIGENEDVLDIGCGCGISSRQAARLAASATVLGVDLSGPMIDQARRCSSDEGLANTAFLQADAQVHPFAPQSFDIAISRFGAMFFSDPVAAFTNVAGALRSGGRLALLAWQDLANNDWVLALRTALAASRSLPEPPSGVPGPFGLAEEEEVRRILVEAGFDAVELTAVREPIYLGADVADAFGFVREMGLTKGLLAGLDKSASAQALRRLRETLSANASDDGVLIGSAAWLITARHA